MKALRKVALAYYESGTDEERRLFNQFFQSMDKNGSRRVSYREFSDFMSEQAHDENMRTRDFFNQLDINGSGGLDFEEVLTLYYILKSRRPICGRCKIFITNEYFTCMGCFEARQAAYSMCLKCFSDKRLLNHYHDRSFFVDNFALLESLRKNHLPNHQPSSGSSGSQGTTPRPPSHSTSSSHRAERRPSSSSQGTAQRLRSRSESPSNRAIVRYNPNFAAVRRPSSGSSGSQGTTPRPPSHSTSSSHRAERRPSSGSSGSQGATPRPPGHPTSSSNSAVVPYNPNIPGVRRYPWQAALALLEAGIHLASIIAGCSIM